MKSNEDVEKRVHLARERTATFLAVLLLLLSSAASAHLPAYEGERVRNDNHFTSEGFAWPVRGECDITAVGPTDPDAGSANIYLGPPNVPPNFFCGFTTQDDWSFEFPVDIIDSSRTPAPDPEDLGQPVEEGYIPCSPANPDPFQCPREIPNPSRPGTSIRLPGKCVDTGQPGEDGSASEPDGEYHCGLLPGAPRPRTSAVHFSTLTGSDDVDWGVYRYDPVYAEVPIVGAPQVPACSETIDSFVTFAYAGPLGLRDARTGEPLFRPIDRVRGLPREVRKNLPDDYGIRVSRPSSYAPSRREPRAGYASGFAQNGWLLAEDSVVQCIDDFETCLADDTGELSKHYDYNDIFFVNEERPIDLYLMWWVDDEPRHGRHLGRYLRDAHRERDDDHDEDRDRHERKRKRHKKDRTLTDVSITTGVIDQFIIGDFINIGITGPFSGNGRYIHGTCRDPRPTGKVEIIIETN